MKIKNSGRILEKIRLMNMKKMLIPFNKSTKAIIHQEVQKILPSNIWKILYNITNFCMNNTLRTVFENMIYHAKEWKPFIYSSWIDYLHTK